MTVRQKVPKSIFETLYFLKNTPNFWQTVIHCTQKTQWFPLNLLIFGQKSCFLGHTVFEIPQPKWHQIGQLTVLSISKLFEVPAPFRPHSILHLWLSFCLELSVTYFGLYVRCIDLNFESSNTETSERILKIYQIGTKSFKLNKYRKVVSINVCN